MRAKMGVYMHFYSHLFPPNHQRVRLFSVTFPSYCQFLMLFKINSYKSKGMNKKLKYKIFYETKWSLKKYFGKI